MFFRVSLTVQMAIATLLGLLTGLFFGDLCRVFSPYANAYIMILKITAVPYLIGAIIYGVGQLSVSQAKMILKQGVFFVLIAWSINILMIYSTYFLFPKSRTAQLTGYIAGNTPSINFFDLLIPENIFYDLSNNIIPSIVIFALLIGISLMHLKEKQVVLQGFQILVEALTKITGWIAKITPLGTFIIIANQAGTIQFSTVKQVSSYIILYILCISLIVFWIFPRIINMLTHIPWYKWLQQMFPILLLAYTTNIVIICLPYIIELLKKETSTIDPYDDKAQKQIQGTVSVIFNLPMGSLFITLFVLFLSLFYNVPLSVGSQVEMFFTAFLTGLGAVGIGSWINTLSFMLVSLGLPQESLSLFLTTTPFTAGFQAMISSMQITSLSLFIILASRKLVQWQFSKICKGIVIAFVPVFCIFGLIKAFNPLPEITNDKKSIFELSIASDIPVTVYTTLPSISNDPQEDAFVRIMRTKKLRVGYTPIVAPFAFYNLHHNLVGYDIAFAYELAYDLGCQLELIPMSYAHVTEELSNGLYDIAMSSLSLSEQRLKNVAFSQSYLQPKFVFLAKPGKKKYFSSLASVRNDPSLTIGVLKGTSYEYVVKELFPLHKIILLNETNDVLVHPEVDALFWTEYEGTAWTLLHREFRVVFPSPTMGEDSIAYATGFQSTQLLSYINQWMSLKKVQGFTERQYNLWVLEKTEIIANTAPRWSILRYLEKSASKKDLHQR